MYGEQHPYTGLVANSGHKNISEYCGKERYFLTTTKTTPQEQSTAVFTDYGKPAFMSERESA